MSASNHKLSNGGKGKVYKILGGSSIIDTRMPSSTEVNAGKVAGFSPEQLTSIGKSGDPIRRLLLQHNIPYSDKGYWDPPQQPGRHRNAGTSGMEGSNKLERIFQDPAMAYRVHISETGDFRAIGAGGDVRYQALDGGWDRGFVKAAGALAGATIPGKVFTFELTPKKDKWTSFKQWNRFTNYYAAIMRRWANSTKPLSHLRFDVNAPLMADMGELDLNPHGSPLYCNIEPEYNFLIDEYEEVLNNYDPVSSGGQGRSVYHLLPTPYVHLSEKMGNYKDADQSIYSQHMTLGGSIKGVAEDMIGDKGKKIGEKDSGQYFEKWAAVWAREPGDNDQPTRIGSGRGRSMNYPSITYFPSEIARGDFFSQVHATRELYPMHINVEFSTTKVLVNSFAAAAEEADMLNFMSGRVVQGASYPMLDHRGLQSVDQSAMIFSDLSTDNALFEKQEEIIRTAEEKGWSAMQWERGHSGMRTWSVKGLLDYRDGDHDWSAIRGTIFHPLGGMPDEMTAIDDRDEPRAMVIGPAGDTVMRDGPGDKLEFNVLQLALRGKINKFVKRNTLSYSEILMSQDDEAEKPSLLFGQGNIRKEHLESHDYASPRRCYSETVMYRLRKYVSPTKGEKFSGAAVQDFYFVNSSKLDVIKYIDTQVKYGERYEYDMYAYQLVVKHNIHFNNPVRPWDGNWHNLRVEGVVDPELIVAEIPIKMMRNNEPYLVVDDPPLPPEVDFIPYKGVDDEILININSSSGRKIMHPIVINPIDELQFDKVRHVQRLGENGGKSPAIRFTGDDSPSVFEIYRTTLPPTDEDGYTHFSGQLHRHIGPEVKGNLRASSAAFVDNIRPNTTYYYLIRAVDYHGHISNPTAIYEVEMVNSASPEQLRQGLTGIIYPKIRTVELQEDIPRKYSKQMKKYIQIKPAFAQQVINEEESRYTTKASAMDVVDTDIKFGVNEESVWGKTYKIRLTSRTSGKKIDLNVTIKKTYDLKQV